MTDDQRQRLIKLAEAAQVCTDVAEEKDAFIDWTPWADLGNTILNQAEKLNAEYAAMEHHD